MKRPLSAPSTEERYLEQSVAHRLGVPIAFVLDADESDVSDGRLISAQIQCTNHRDFNAIFAKLLRHRCILRYVQFIKQTEHLQVTYVEINHTRQPE